MWLMIFGVIMGLAFAGLATWVSLARGKPLQAAADANAGPDRDALMIEVANKFKIQTNSQIVALYIIAAFVAIAPLRPYILPVKYPDTLFWLSGTFRHYNSGNGTLWLRPQTAVVQDAGDFLYPLVFPASQSTTGFATDSTNYLPVSIEVVLDPTRTAGQILEVVNGTNTALKGSFDFTEHRIAISSPICLSYSTPPPVPGPTATLTPQKPVSAALLQKAASVPVAPAPPTAVLAQGESSTC